MNNIKISITIPAYKKRFLKECIESVLDQTYQNFELIILNDASPEDLLSVVNQYSDSRIRYFENEENAGAINLVDVWNKCLKYAVGGYIICMGDDDKLLPNSLQDYIYLIEKYPGLGIYHARTEVIDEKSNFVSVAPSLPDYESVYSLMLHSWNGYRQFIGNYLFEVSTLRNNGGFYKLPLAWSSDKISISIAAMKNGIANTQSIAFQYRVNNLSISSSGDSIIKMRAILKSEKWHRFFLKKNPSDEIDSKIRQMLLASFEKQFDGMKIYTIQYDLKSNSIFRIFFWLKNKRKYKLNSYTILVAFLLAIKKKMVKILCCCSH